MWRYDVDNDCIVLTGETSKDFMRKVLNKSRVNYQPVFGQIVVNSTDDGFDADFAEPNDARVSDHFRDAAKKESTISMDNSDYIITCYSKDNEHVKSKVYHDYYEALEVFSCLISKENSEQCSCVDMLRKNWNDGKIERIGRIDFC